MEEKKTEEEGKMSVRWETEGLQTVGIVCLVIMFLKLMHLLGLIDITETGNPNPPVDIRILISSVWLIDFKRSRGTSEVSRNIKPVQ